MERRQFLVGTSTAAVAGLAGCTSFGGSEGDGGTGDSDQLLEVQDSELTEDGGMTIIEGEAENVAGEELIGATVVADIYDEDGDSLADDDELMGLVGEDDILEADETESFEIHLPTELSADDIDDYELSVGEATQTRGA